MIALKQILVPTDFSESSEAAVRYAKAFAETFGASLHLLHVIESPVVYGWEVYNPALVRDNVEKLAREQLGKVLTDAEIARYHVQLATLAGSPFVEIIRYAREKDIDLIVMGTHGHSGLVHVLLGSVSEKVVRKAPCPVLTVKTPLTEARSASGTRQEPATA